ncbi:MAG: ATP-binding cassette domain-containing protein [Bifidobacteriaceae bacterium]|jgi:ABC-type multidrug transport system ATPase subunit|nr:ATP-binding cassette domain-containing protein [Bifidobacteriaceae bacterium]
MNTPGERAASAAGNVVVDARGVGVREGSAVLLAPVDLTLAAGQVILLTGPNGVGKTTLLRVLSGQSRPSSGALAVCGLTPDQRRPAFRRRVAHLLAPRSFSPTMTIAEHVTLAALTWGFTAHDAAGLARRRLGQFDIGALGSRFPHQLSLGQSQAASLCVSLARPFDLLLLDEPDQALDDDRLAALEAVLGEAAEDGAAAVVATHSRALRAAMADSVIELSRLSRAQAV